ncbi:suppressor of lurcher protein 1 [Caerostris extrusa]|uniref:Suppressor of lurcher protein 1 n=1 Tax=Caerostris extrusa TaxID=172846 RepID=A0AAV4T4W9_CAEEX|nr:suppressor of lurcher protein 1 [Caerostris extrusa]
MSEIRNFTICETSHFGCPAVKTSLSERRVTLFDPYASLFVRSRNYLGKLRIYYIVNGENGCQNGTLLGKKLTLFGEEIIAAANACGQEITSVGSKNGTFTSPNYPDPYPSEVYCVYKFIGKEKERIQISFTDFDLHLPHEPPKE